MNSKLIILGSSGFIGRNLLTVLDSNNITYDLIVRNKNIIAQHAKNANHIYECDLNDYHNILKIFENNRYEKCIDLAWYCGDGYQNSIMNFDWIYITMQIARFFAQNGGKKFLFAGSVFEYEKTNSLLDENTTSLKTNVFYGKAKTICFIALKEYFERQNIQFKDARIFNLFGNYEKSTRLIPYIIQQALKKDNILLNSNIIQDYSYVLDTCNAIYKLLESNVVGPVNICSGIPISINDLAVKICNIVGCPIEKIQFKTKSNDYILGNNNRLKNEVCYVYKYNIDDSIINTIRIYENNKI